MAFVHGRGTVVSLDADDLSSFSKKVSFEREADTHDVTTFGNDSKNYASGLKDGTATMEGIYDNTVSTGPGAVLRPLIGGAAVELIYQPEGVGTGRPTATVDVLVKKYTEDAATDDMITWTADLQFTGDIADATQV